MTRPPSSTKRRSTSLMGARSAAEAPTSKTRQVPMPRAGIVSPLDGMRRSSPAAAARPGRRAAPGRRAGAQETQRRAPRQGAVDSYHRSFPP